MCGSQQTGKFLKRREYQTTLPASWESCMQVKKQELEPVMEQQTGSKLGKEYIKVVYCHPDYMQSTSWEIPGWMKHSWNHVCWEKHQYPQICTWHHPHGRKQRGTKSLLLKVKEESEKPGLKLKIQKTKIMTSGPITSRQKDEKQWKQWETLLSWAPKSLQMVTAAVKLKDTCSLGEKLWQT